MKRAILVIGMLLAFDAQAAFISGNELMRQCAEFEKRRGTFEDGLCGGFVTGVADVAANSLVRGYRVCFPKQVVTGQLTLVVIKYLREHPEDLHYGADSLVLTALEGAFPCSK